MPRTLPRLVAAALWLFALPAVAESVRAVVHGVEAVNIRRGPGTDSPAFRAIARGTRVQVEDVSAQWAHIKLDDGDSGYINIAYLQLEPGATFPPAAPTPPSTPDAASAPAAEGVVAEAPQAAALESQIEQLRSRLAALESAVVTPSAEAPAAAPTPPILAPIAAPVAPSDQLEIGPMLALAGVGLVVGFLLGTAYGQRLERHRRLRVRF